MSANGSITPGQDLKEDGISVEGSIDNSNNQTIVSEVHSEIHQVSGKVFSTTRGDYVPMTITLDTGAK
jgi:hypothetical protein